MTMFLSLNDFVNSTKNYQHYRKELKNAKPPLIPYMGNYRLIKICLFLAVYLRDLTFIEDGNKNLRSNGMVNFEKMSMLSKVFSEGIFSILSFFLILVAELQKHSYNFVEVASIRELLVNTKVIRDDKVLYKQATASEKNDSQKSGIFRKGPEIPPEKSKSEVKIKVAEIQPLKIKSSSLITIRRKTTKKSIKVVLVGDGMVGRVIEISLKFPRWERHLYWLPTQPSHSQQWNMFPRFLIIIILSKGWMIEK
jgi:hypothetical protein